MRKFSLFPSVIALTLALGACSADEPATDQPINSEVAVGSEDLGPPPPPEPVGDASVQPPSPPVTADSDGKATKRLSFAPGESSARVNGSITGYDTMTYLLNVREGQSMNVSMATANTATYFNIIPPGEDAASFNGSINGNMYEGVAAKSGDYKIEIYMMRSAARREEKADFGLEVAVN